jgi:hypothetical protein
VALLMDLHAMANPSNNNQSRRPPVLIDVRRHDERALYGSIPGVSFTLPCLPRILNLYDHLQR